MKFEDIPFVTVASSNHASPTGALPFLLPSAQSPSTAAVPSSRIQRWVRDVTGAKNNETTISELGTESQQGLVRGGAASAARDVSSDMRYEAYIALLDHRIRNAYVRTLLKTTIHWKLKLLSSSSPSIFRLRTSLP